MEVEANTAYANGNINTRIEILHAEQVEYDDTGRTFDWVDCITAFRDTTDGVIDGVHDTRDAYGCDMNASSSSS